MNLRELIAELESITMAAPSPVPDYARLGEHLNSLGFRPTVYFEGQHIALAEDNSMEAIVETMAPATIWWQRDDGQKVIQCALVTGETLLFWPDAAEDFQSQLARLGERFAKPNILGEQPTGFFSLNMDPATGTPNPQVLPTTGPAEANDSLGLSGGTDGQGRPITG